MWYTSLNIGARSSADSANCDTGGSMNIGLLGYGSIAGSHVRAIRSLADPDLRLHAVMGRLAEPSAQFAREHGLIRSTTDLDELLADPALEVVIVCSPSDVHAQQTERALRAGKHVL